MALQGEGQVCPIKSTAGIWQIYGLQLGTKQARCSPDFHELSEGRKGKGCYMLGIITFNLHTCPSEHSYHQFGDGEKFTILSKVTPLRAQAGIQAPVI